MLFNIKLKTQKLQLFMPSGEKHPNRVSIKCRKINAGKVDGAIQCYTQLHLTVFTICVYLVRILSSQKIPYHLAMVIVTSMAAVFNNNKTKMMASWSAVSILYSFILSKDVKWAILHWSLCLSNVGSLVRISCSMLKVEHSFERRNLYNLRFSESEICLPLFEYETQPEHKKRTRICL